MPGVKFRDTGFAARLRSTRKLRQMTQVELARRIGASPARISLLEAGGPGRSGQRTNFLPEIAVALDVDATWLVLGIGKRPLLATPELQDAEPSTVVPFRSAAEEAKRIWETVPDPIRKTRFVGKWRIKPSKSWKDKLPARRRA